MCRRSSRHVGIFDKTVGSAMSSGRTRGERRERLQLRFEAWPWHARVDRLDEMRADRLNREAGFETSGAYKEWITSYPEIESPTHVFSDQSGVTGSAPG